MKKYERLCLIFLLIPFFVSSDQAGSTFFTCYKENKNAMQVIACLDNAHYNSRLQLNKLENQLLQIFSKLDQVSSKPQGVNALKGAKLRFQSWKEAQCRMVEASYQSDNSRKQAYLSCLVDLTGEQIERLNNLIGINN